MFTTGKEWTEEDIKFLKDNYITMTTRELANSLDRTYSSVENKRGKLGLKDERKYNFDFDFFKDPLTEHSAYWLGFIGADGYVSDEGKSLGITLKNDDYEHLKKFNKTLNGNVPVVFRERVATVISGRQTGIRKQCSIRLYSTEMVKDLYSYGIVPRKSLIIEFPPIKDDYLLWCYIRGYFDGDGSLYYDKRSNQLRAKITSGSYSFIESFSEYLKRFEIKTYITSNKTDCGITGKECTRLFLSKIYDNANIYLDRKYKKYKKYKYLFGFNE